MKKSEVNWQPKAPQRICSRCAFMIRGGDYKEKFRCDKHQWMTKGNAVCDSFQPAEDKHVHDGR